MRKGPWHQFGDRSQRMALEQLQSGIGEGIILSPRDLSWSKSQHYSRLYGELGADVLIDQQFYFPDYSNANLKSYSISCHRASVNQLCQISDTELIELSNHLIEINRGLASSAVIAPAVVYESGRSDIIQLNGRLFSAAKRAGESLAIPTYASVMVGLSVTSSNETLMSVLSHATSLDADGWYFGYQFPDERIPSNLQDVFRFCTAGISLACTGKPVLHAYAGPMGLLSLAVGATGAGIGHFQNQWRFSPRRWQSGSGQGGGGDAPPRYFSTNLWGTIVYPDELVQLSSQLRTSVITPSPFSSQVSTSSQMLWSRWDANKHLIYLICSKISSFSGTQSSRQIARDVIQILDNAISLHQDILNSGINLSDNTSAYQANWRTAIANLLSNQSQDFDYLELIT